MKLFSFQDTLGACLCDYSSNFQELPIERLDADIYQPIVFLTQTLRVKTVLISH